MIDLRDLQTPLSQIRFHLRSRFRVLEHEPPPFASSARVTLSDAHMLMLLTHLKVAFGADIGASQKRYMDGVEGDANAPTFEALHRDSWFQILFGRIVTPLRISAAACHVTSELPGLADLIRDRFGISYDFSTVPIGIKPIDDVMRRVDAKELCFTEITCRTPVWVVARLWEDKPAVDDQLVWWLDRWNLLERPLFSPSLVWDEAMAKDFVRLVLERLEGETALVGWDMIRETVAAQSMRAERQIGVASPDCLPEIPDGRVARVRWLSDPWLSDALQRREETFEEVTDLVAVIAEDVVRRRFSQAADPQFFRMFELALARPDLLNMLVAHAVRHPLTIAELLIQPDTCALGCWLLIMRLEMQSLQVDEFQDREFVLSALQDGLSLLQRFSEREVSGNHLGEVASLVAAVFDPVGRPRDRLRGKAIETMVVGALQEIGEAAAPIVDLLTKENSPDSLDAPCFIAALELVAAADLVELVKRDPLPCKYMRAVKAGDSRLSADRVSASGASALFRLASRFDKSRLSRFLYPCDWQAELAGLGDDEYVKRQRIIRSLEVITRILAKAVIGLKGAPADGLVEALTAHVSAGAVDNWPDGKIWAFGDEINHLLWFEPPRATIGTLLGKALSMLEKTSREKLLLACLELCDPAILADVHKAGPNDIRSRISARINELGVNGATQYRFVTTANARIDALLNAGLVDAAEIHLQHTSQMDPKGKLSERQRIKFNQEMRLHFLKGAWDKIENVTIPDGLSQIDREVCEHIRESYQAIALLQGVNANPDAAVSRLENLVRKDPVEHRHHINLFAAKIAAVLGRVSFPILAIADQKPARQLLAQVEKWMETTAELNDEDRYICISNLVPLDLALGDPRRALERLRSLPQKSESATHAAYLAIAYGRLNRRDDAFDTLRKAHEVFGENELLKAACDYLVNDRSTEALGAPRRLILAIPPEEKLRLKSAITRFHNMSANEKAEILLSQREALPTLVADYVDNALSGVINLAPLIEKSAIRNGEDDITAIVKQLLNNAFRFLGWSIHDQSKGGYTPKGNYGERDLVLVDGATELAVLEAVVADGGVPKDDLVKHFRKLLGYGDCPLHFFLTYAWLSNTSKLIQVLHDIAKEEVPEGYSFEGLEPRAKVGADPHGFTAQYLVGGQAIMVVFRVLDLGQERLRNAAKSSMQLTDNPSRKRKAKKDNG